MSLEFFRAPEFDAWRGVDIESPVPQAYITADRKLLKIEWPDRPTTFHLPETWKSVQFDNVAAAYHAAYGREMEA